MVLRFEPAGRSAAICEVLEGSASRPFLTETATDPTEPISASGSAFAPRSAGLPNSPELAPPSGGRRRSGRRRWSASLPPEQEQADHSPNYDYRHNSPDDRIPLHGGHSQERGIDCDAD